MVKRIIETNKHLNDEEKRFEAMFHNLYVSFEIEGIKIPIEEAKKIAQAVRVELLGSKSQKIHQ